MEPENNCTEEQQEQELKGLQDEEEGAMLRRRISSHPLYGLLVETHLNCLKVIEFNYIICAHLIMYRCICKGKLNTRTEILELSTSLKGVF